VKRVLAVALVVGSLGVATGRAAAKPSAPDHWDPRVEKYVEFVEKHRKLEFDHPVRVEFLDDAAFVRAYQGDDPKVTKEDRRDAEQIAGQLRALGLIEGPVDLIQSQRDLDATDTVGFYDQERKALFVRGTDLSDTDVRITLVHELTHALQDQHFDLTELDDTVETSGQDFALTALVEGDATSVEDDYLFSLPPAEQDAYFAEDPGDATTDAATDAPDLASSSDIPPVLDLFTSGPYIFGSRYVELLRQAGGRERRDRAFADPPVTEEEIVDPVAARVARPARRVRTPELTAGERRHGDADDFGAFSLYLVLAARIDPQTALRAAEGWGGDRYVGFTRRESGGQECVRIAFTGDTAADTDEIADALLQWTAALPAGAASSLQTGNRVDLTACDTGTTPAPSEDTLDAAVTLLVDRNDLALELLHARVPPVMARCAGDRLAADPELVLLRRAGVHAEPGRPLHPVAHRRGGRLPHALTERRGRISPSPAS
jgi:hypothetical protein